MLKGEMRTAQIMKDKEMMMKKKKRRAMIMSKPHKKEMKEKAM